MPPSFATYHVALRYDVRYDVLVQSGGRESEHAVLVQDVGIEAMTRAGGWLGPPGDEGGRAMLGGGFAGRGAAAQGLMLGGDEGVEPPAYEP